MRFGNEERNFWKKVYKTKGCWFWIGSLGSDGYGQYKSSIGHKACNGKRKGEQEEANIAYIAYTRSMEHLTIVNEEK